MPDRWQKWALYDVPPLDRWGDGPVTLLGDAAHPMLPFLAQGAAMAIEDAAMLTDNLARSPDDPAAAMRRYERARRRRTARVQRAARSNGRIYHLTAGEALARNLFLRVAGGKMLLRRYNWLYDWRTAPPGSPLVRTRCPARTRGAGLNREEPIRMFPTTIAGTLPKPSWLAEPDKLWPQWRLAGADLESGKLDATLLAVKLQEDAGIDIVTDGEQSRQHFVHGFLEFVDGIDFANKVEMGIRNDRYKAMVPTVTGPLKLKGRVHGREARHARAHTKHKLKITMPGPMTIIDTIADRHYGDRVAWRSPSPTCSTPRRARSKPTAST